MMNESRERIEDLAGRAIDGFLTPDEANELASILRSSPEARKILASYMRLEGARIQLGALGCLTQSRDERSRAPARRATARPARVSARGSVGAWTAAAAVLIGAVAILAWAVLGPGRERAVDSPTAAKDSPGRAEVRAPQDRPGERPTSPAVEERPPLRDGKEARSEPDPRETPIPSPGPKEGPDPDREKRVARTDPGTGVVPSPESEPDRAEAPRPGASPAQKETLPGDTVVRTMTLERVEGDVQLLAATGRRPVRAGEGLLPGQGLETGGKKSAAVVTYPDGTRLELGAETQIRDVYDVNFPAPGREAGGKRVFVTRGTLAAHVRKQPSDRPMVLSTPHGDAKVVGTTLALTVDPDARGQSRLEVREGRVRFTRSQDGRTVDVAAGTYTVASFRSGEMVARPLPGISESFQDGVSPSPDYFGTRDTYISERAPGSNFGAAKVLLAEPDEPRGGKRKAQWPLLRWDVSAIPPGSRVTAASITLFVGETSAGQPFNVYEMNRPWSETEATWKMAASGSPWKISGGMASVEKDMVAVGVLAPFVRGEYTITLNEYGVALVQSWVNAPPSNNGVIIATSAAKQGLHISSREAQPAETRPKLTLTYTPRR